jgi:tetratricopeptide (TPR) repeat protein
MKKHWIALATVCLILSSLAAQSSLGLVYKGMLAWQKNDFKTAISYFKRAVDENPDDGDTIKLLGMAYYNDGQYREAIEALNRSLNATHKKDTEDQSWMYLALAQDKLGFGDTALSSCQKAIECSPRNAGYFAFLSHLYNSKEQYDEAITAAKRSIELGVSSHSGYDNLGYAYGKKREYGKALEAYKAAINIAPTIAHYPSEKGNLLSVMKEYAEAAKAYQKAVDLQPSNTGYLTRLAIAHCTAGQFDRAVESAAKIISLLTYSGIGVVLANELSYPAVKEVSPDGPAQKAGLKAGDKIIKIGRDSTKGWDLAKAHESLRGKPGSQVELRIQRDGESKPLEKTLLRETMLPKTAVLALWVRSVAYRYQGRLDEALKDAEQAYTLNPASPDAQEGLAGAYLETRRYEEAVKLLSALKRNPYVLLLEAKAQAKQGRLAEAMSLYGSIPEDGMNLKDIPIKTERSALLEMFKPAVAQFREAAKSFETKRQHKDALAQLVQALAIADEAEAASIQDALFDLARNYPALSQVPDDARKHLLRAEILIKETDFELAATEYQKAIRFAPQIGRLYFDYALLCEQNTNYTDAIRSMKLYLKAIPDAPDAQAAKDAIVKWEFALERQKDPL